MKPSLPPVNRDHKKKKIIFKLTYIKKVNILAKKTLKIFTVAFSVNVMFTREINIHQVKKLTETNFEFYCSIGIIKLTHN